MSDLSKVSIAGQTEDTKYASFDITNGAGQLSKAGVTVQRGGTGEAEVNIRLKIVTNTASKSWFHDNKTTFTTDQQSTINAHFDKHDTASGWNAIFAYGSSNSSNQNLYKNATAKHVQTEDKQQSDLVKSASLNKSEEVDVTGSVTMVGTSFIPTTAFVFAEISTITFTNGNTMTVVNSTAQAAQANGSTDGVETKAGTGQLKVVALPT